MLRPADCASHSSAPDDPELSGLVFEPFKAMLRWEGYGTAGCAISGGALDECLKGGLDVSHTRGRPHGQTYLPAFQAR